MEIRLIKQSDFKEIYELWQKTGLTLSSMEKDEDEFKSMLKYNPKSCFVLKRKNKIIGTIFGTFNGRRAWVYHLAVDPDYQREGYGTSLLKKVEDELKNHDVNKILLGILYPNISVAGFYVKNGYKLMNESIIMEKEI